MNKNLATIFLLVGAVALNLGMLCQAHAGNRPSDGNAAVMAAVRNATALFAASGPEDGTTVASEGGQRPSAGGCACASDDSGTHIYFNLSVAAADPGPQGPALTAPAAAAAVFSSPPSIPQDRPPRPSA